MLEEEQTSGELINEKLKKAQAQVNLPFFQRYSLVAAISGRTTDLRADYGAIAVRAS